MSSAIKPLLPADNPEQHFRLLVVSKEPAVVRSLAALGDNSQLLVEIASSGWDAMERMESGEAPHLLLLDLPRGNGDSFHMLRWLRRLNPELPVAAICDAEDSLVRQEAVRLGAEQILSRPLDPTQIQSLLRCFGLYSALRGVNSGANWADEGLSSDDLDGGNIDIEHPERDVFFAALNPAMQKLRAQVELLAQSDVPIFLTGELGSGKIAVARMIHALSPRSRFRLLQVDCAALPAVALEAQLFGDGGVFDGWAAPPPAGVPPTDSRLAQLRPASRSERGTIFLQEIAAMPTGVQDRLLEVLERLEARKNVESLKTIGGRAEALDPASLAGVRVLSATSENLEHVLAGNRLRPELYHRLSAFTLQVPALRQRREDIPILLRHAMSKLASRYGLAAREFSPAMLEACQQYAWPGNLTELEAFVKRYLVGASAELRPIGAGMPVDKGYRRRDADRGNGHGTLTERESENENDHQDRQAGSALVFENAVAGGGGQTAPRSLKSFIQDIKCEAERKAIGAALERTGWNRKAAARLLRISYRTLLYKVEQYQMKAAESLFCPAPLKPMDAAENVDRQNGKAS
jgi:DNA-binding NtrC family response regulator